MIKAVSEVMPTAEGGDASCSISIGDTADTATVAKEFTMAFHVPPVLSYVSPSSVFTTGGEVFVTVGLLDFPAVKGTSDVAVQLFDGAALPVLSIVQSSAETIVTFSAPKSEDGAAAIVIGEVWASQLAHVPRVAFSLGCRERLPAVETITPMRAPMTLDADEPTVVEILILYLQPVTERGQVRISVADGGVWSVSEIVYSDSGGTLLRLLPSEVKPQAPRR
jgi:hypothetical protein